MQTASSPYSTPCSLILLEHRFRRKLAEVFFNTGIKGCLALASANYFDPPLMGILCTMNVISFELGLL